MSLVACLHSKVKPEHTDELMSFLEEKLPAVRGFEGCRNVSIYLNKENGDMIFNEQWASKEAHEQYLLSIQNNGVMSQLLGYLASPPNVSYFEKLDI